MPEPPKEYFFYHGKEVPDIRIPGGNLFLSEALARLPPKSPHWKDLEKIDFHRDDYPSTEAYVLIGRDHSRISPRIQNPTGNGVMEGITTRGRKHLFSGPVIAALYLSFRDYDLPASSLIQERAEIPTAIGLAPLNSLVSLEDCPTGTFRYGPSLEHLVEDRKVGGKHLLSEMIMHLPPLAEEHQLLESIDYTRTDYTFGELSTLSGLHSKSLQRLAWFERRHGPIPGLQKQEGNKPHLLTGSAAAHVLLADVTLLSQTMEPEAFVLAPALQYQRKWREERDETAFRNFAHWVERRFYRTARSILPSYHDAKNALQETLIKISKTDFRDMDEAHFYFYIKRMVKNHAVTEHRRMERAGDLASIFSSSIDPYKMVGVDWENRLLPPEMTLARWREDPSNTLQTLIEGEATDPHQGNLSSNLN